MLRSPSTSVVAAMASQLVDANLADDEIIA